MIVADKLTKTFASHYALRDISFTAGREKIALLGFNGAGKSTLAKLIAGILRPSSGEILVFGERPWRSREVRRRIGIVTHNPMLYRELTVRENLEFYSKLYGCDLAEIVNLLGLADKLDVKVSHLSMGWIRRVALARALLNDPDVLVVDEGIAGLDVEARALVLEMLSGFDGCLIYSTHDVGEAEFCDRYIVLSGGKLVYDGESLEDAVASLR